MTAVGSWDVTLSAIPGGKHAEQNIKELTKVDDLSLDLLFLHGPFSQPASP